MAAKKHSWNYENIGGSTRVKISTGADIAHLGELDVKKWSVLSCPVTGLEVDEKSLKYIDTDGDGRIRVADVVATSQWLTAVVKDADLLVKGADCINVEHFNQENADGKKLYNSARQILVNLAKEGSVISLADTKDITAIFAKTRFNGDGVITEQTAEAAEEKAVIAAIVNTLGGVADRCGVNGANAEFIEKFYQALADYVAWSEAVVDAPYGADTDKAIEAYNALDVKVKDYFVRAELASFSPESAAKLDVQTALIETISADNLTAKTDEIAAYPIARITGKAVLDAGAAINPAWSAKFNTLMSIVKPAEKGLTAESWAAIGASFAAYNAWKAAKKGGEVEALGIDTIKKMLADDKKQALLDLVAQDLALKEEAEGIDLVDKFMHIYRDFYRLLRNFVTFQDFYTRNKEVKAVFQSGRLIIDQRECRMCMLVTDMAKHNTMAPASCMYLVYCDCTTKTSPAKLNVVAAITVGDVGDLAVGKNAIYYDNKGQLWDAVITKIVDNPISVGQAFWSPYRRMATTIENLINKTADSSLISQVISSGKEVGVHYSAFDTHKVTGSSSCCATLIYKCRVPTCDSNIAITVTGGIISKIRFQSDHNHRPTTDERREVECSVCYQSGHNKRSCPTALEMKRWKEGPWIGSIKRKWFGTDGWKLCSFKRIDLLRITAHLDVSMCENVRNYFYYAPNNSNGIYVKLNLFKKLFEMNEKIEVSIQWILNGKCSRRLGNDEGIRGSMIYAFHWYLVYKLLDDPENVASRIGKNSTGIIDQLKQYEESLGGAGFTIELQQVSGALAETQLWLEHALLVISSVKDKRLIVNRENMHEVCNSLVRTFVEEMVVTGDDGSDMSHRLLKGCWILKDVKICMPLDLDKYRPHLKRLRTARLSRWTGPPPS